MTTTSETTWPDRTLGDLVASVPGSARVLESFGLDYCCRGARPLAEACAQDAVDVNEVVAELRDLAPGPAPKWSSMPPAELVDHLESTHHRYLHAELPRLDALAQKVASVHGGRHPELMDVLSDLRELRDDLEPHLAKEESVLFPAVRHLVAEADAGRPTTQLDAPIRVMRAEHDRAGELLAQLRADARDFAVPDDGCASYRALYEGLAELESDTHLHVHKENHLLFPAVEALGG
jgi:regulator of cell morphogenesis and NO signaling